jgi:hypothetical protein
MILQNKARPKNLRIAHERWEVVLTLILMSTYITRMT